MTRDSSRPSWAGEKWCGLFLLVVSPGIAFGCRGSQEKPVGRNGASVTPVPAAVGTLQKIVRETGAPARENGRGVRLIRGEKGQSPEQGAAILAGDRIVTDEQTRVVIEEEAGQTISLAAGSQLDLGENSAFLERGGCS